MHAADIGRMADRDRAALAAFIGETPGSVIAVHALRSGAGRAWVAGAPDAPEAVVVEPALLPGEPQGYGAVGAVLDLLEGVDGWDCIELSAEAADRGEAEFTRRWGPARRVVDVLHVLRDAPGDVAMHPLVRPIRPAELSELAPRDDESEMLPAGTLSESAAALGRMFAAVDGGSIVGHGTSFAAGERYADVGVHVAPAYRRQGIASTCAALACRAVMADGLVPVWGCGSHNAASLATAAALGFTEVDRMVYLVPERERAVG